MPIVLIPGFMLDRDLWADIEPALAPFGPLTHAVPDTGDTLPEMARHILQAAPQRFTLIGFSLGGYVARDIARLAPERVSRLILIATSSRGDNALQEQRRAQATHSTPRTFGGISRRSIRQSLAPANRQDIALINRIHAMSVRLGSEVFRRQSALHRVGDAANLGAIQCPTLILAGQEDALRSAEEARELHEGIPESRLLFMPAGRMIPLEAPDELADALTAFLRESRPAN